MICITFILMDKLKCGYCESNIGYATLDMTVNEYVEDIIIN